MDKYTFAFYYEKNNFQRKYCPWQSKKAAWTSCWFPCGNCFPNLVKFAKNCQSQNISPFQWKFFALFGPNSVKFGNMAKNFGVKNVPFLGSKFGENFHKGS
jgi:hypothetical protein